MEVYQIEQSEEKGTVLVGVESQKKAGREAPEMRAAKSSESRKRELLRHKLFLLELHFDVCEF